MIQTTNGRFVSCVSLCFPCYAQGAEIHEIFGKGKRFSERAHTSLILGLVITIAAIFYTADPHLNGFRLLPRAPKKN